jgi:predicted permease
MVRDFRYAIRVLLRSPLFTTVAALSLAIGIGGAATVFTVLNAVVLRSLPVPDPDQLHLAEKHTAGEVSPRYSWVLFEQAREEVKGRAELFAATNMTSMNVRIAGRTDPDAAQRALVQLISGEYFGVLRQHAQLGRLIEPTDNTTAASPVAVISDTFWERRFRRAADIVGRELVIGGTSLTIVGVASPGFFGPFLGVRNPEVWVPLMRQPEIRYAFNASSSGQSDIRKPWAPQPGIEWLHVFARVPRAADVPGVASAMTLVHKRDALPRIDASDSDGRQRLDAERVVLASAQRGVSSMRRDLTAPLYVLLAMVGVLLAITCGNVASLLLARASAREREVAIRSAIGASRWRVIRQLLIETVVLSVIGGGLGLLVATWGRDALLSMFSGSSTAIDLNTGFDWRVLAFATAITILSGLAAGVFPAIRGTRVAPTDALKAQARQVGAGGGRRGALVGKTLVAAQIAFCLLLLIVAGLFIRSMQSLLRTDVGYDREHLLVARMDVRGLGYTNDQRQALYTRVLERLRAVPGVISASISLNGPLGTSERTSSLAVEGYTTAPGERLGTNEEIVTDGYFDNVGLRMVSGRDFSAEDRQPDVRSSIINETMARRFFPQGDAVGKRWSYGDAIDATSPVIVGVVQDAKYVDVRGTPPNMIYRLSAATPDDVLGNLEVRTAGFPAQMVTTIRQVLAEAEPSLPVFDIVTLDERLNRGLANDRLVANLTSAFGTIALVLACLGLYGTISYGVARRVTELGVRMALGADRRSVLWLVVREAMLLVLVGTAIGVPLALAASRAIGSLLHGVRPVDPVAYAIGAAVLMLVAGLAAYVPAHRASRIDPMVALRAE